jgi:hypothetical protein
MCKMHIRRERKEKRLNSSQEKYEPNTRTTASEWLRERERERKRKCVDFIRSIKYSIETMATTYTGQVYMRPYCSCDFLFSVLIMIIIVVSAVQREKCQLYAWRSWRDRLAQQHSTVLNIKQGESCLYSSSKELDCEHMTNRRRKRKYDSMFHEEVEEKQ